MVWHDGPEFSGLREAWRTEPDALLDQLFDGMAEGDALAAQSLAELEPAPVGDALTRVVATLEEHLAASPPGAQVQIGMALYRLTGEQKWADPVAAVLDSAVPWGSRIDAAMALRHVAPSPELREVLLRNVTDAEYLVRYHCCGTLRRWAGLQSDIDEDEALFPLLVRDDDPVAWSLVADALRAAR
jgi:hypothetical protein